MRVVPPSLTVRWGAHLGPLLLVGLLVAIPVAEASTAVPWQEAQVVHGCGLSRTAAGNRILYLNGREETLTLQTTRRIPHQLLTNVVAIFLREHLGYKVNISYLDGFFPEMRPDAEISLPFYKNTITTVNLEVWLPTGFVVYEGKCRPVIKPLGTSGRMGWFMPYDFIERKNIIDHWRVFVSSSSDAVRRFSRTKEELLQLQEQMIDTATSEYYCKAESCTDGMFIPKRCMKSICSVLFASYYDISYFVIDQILYYGLYVKVAWLGPNLNKQFMENNIKFKGDRSVLIFHWTPDVLLRYFHLAPVTFPVCNDFDKIKIYCPYEPRQFFKFLMSDLNKIDNYLYEVLERIDMDPVQYDSLIDMYNQNPNRSVIQTACSWMASNYDMWSKKWKNGEMKQNLYLVGFFPDNRTSDVQEKFLDTGLVPAFNMALEAVNSDPAILGDYNVTAVILNTGCDADIVMLNFITLIKSSSDAGYYSKIIGIVGPACSDTVEPLAGVSKFFNMPIISYGAEGAIFSDRKKYPFFFRTIPENKLFRHVYLQLFKKFNWERIASLTEDGQQYSEYLTPLQDLLQDNGISFNMRKYPEEREVHAMEQYLLDLRNQRYTIIIGDFYADVARTVMCEAYKLKMTGRQGYVWFLPGWLPHRWYDTSTWNKRASETIFCSNEEMIDALEGHMTLSYKYFGDDDHITVRNISVKEWRALYRQAIQQRFNQPAEMNVVESDYGGFTYDAVWTYALALDKLFKENHSYTSDLRSETTVQRFIHYISTTDFYGVSGHINFTFGPSRLTDIIAWQFVKGKYREVGWFYPRPELPTRGVLELHLDKIVWPSGSLPKDGRKECVIEGFRSLLGKSVGCNTAIIILCIICFGFLSVLLVICVAKLRDRYEKKLQEMEAMWREKNAVFKRFEHSGIQIPRNNIVINRKLGEGQFGTVYGGECLIENQWTAVAVKTLKVGSTGSEMLDFLSEAEMMNKFSHENIVKLIGVCTDSEPIYAVMEFMLYGDLKTYLLSRRNLVSEKNREEDDEISNRRLTKMALDVAKALKYIADMKHVHRDVACRNCLVNAHRSVKLGDFGMTRPMNDEGYYRFSRKGMLPVRWMAPESLEKGVYTAKTDIWSYGVLLYEIITFGAFPFKGLINQDAIERIKSGQTIPFPKGIQPQLEYLLRACWEFDPANRPTADKIAEYLSSCPMLISPSLEGPQSLVSIEESSSHEIHFPDFSRKLPLAISHRESCPGPTRKRSMSGNMVMTCPQVSTSVSEDVILSTHTNLDALNLNQVVMEESELGMDPLLPPAQYISSSNFISLSQKDIEKERECLIKRHSSQVSSCGNGKEIWTSTTPV